MFKNFFMKKVLRSQLKGMPEEQQDMIIKMVEKNPDFFKQIGNEIEHKMKHENKTQMSAAMEVMKKHQDELQKLMMESK